MAAPTRLGERIAPLIGARPGEVLVADTLTADLTLRGVTKSVDFDLEFLGSGPGMAPGVTVAGFEATTEIDRREFGVNFEGTLENGSLVVGNKVTIELSIEAAAQA